MKPAVSTLTISFEAPFWVGLYEWEEEGLYQVCKIPFGAEPKDYEVYAFLQRHWKDLTFSPPLPAGTVPRARINPKRLQREIRKQLQTPAIGTKAQQALQLQHAQRVQTRKETARQKRTQAQHRRAALRRADEVLAQEARCVPLCATQRAWLCRPEWEGAALTPAGDLLLCRARRADAQE